MADITKQLADALRKLEQWVSEAADEDGASFDWHAINADEGAQARAALAAHDAEQAAKAVPAGLYVGLIERLMKLSTRLGIAYEGGVEHFAASLEDRLYAICRSAEGLLDSLAAAPTPPAPEAQQAAGQEQDERDAFEAWAISYSTIPLKRDDDASLGFTGYTEMDQTMLWDAWQAAMAHAREAVEAVAVQMPRPASWSGAVTPERVEQMLADYRAAILRALGEQ